MTNFKPDDLVYARDHKRLRVFKVVRVSDKGNLTLATLEQKHLLSSSEVWVADKVDTSIRKIVARLDRKRDDDDDRFVWVRWTEYKDDKRCDKRCGIVYKLESCPYQRVNVSEGSTRADGRRSLIVTYYVPGFD